MLVSLKINKIRIVLTVVLFFMFSISSFAQCAMCRAALGGKENNAQAAAVNDGIVYLMVIPYILVALLGIYIYKMKKK
jgi:heme/copper-type cytochrome/quinol oxidase subunit 2